jgi:hypothetical protein
MITFMEKYKKIILVVGFFMVLGFAYVGVKPVLAQNTLVQTQQAQMESLINQIISLLKQIIQMKIQLAQRTAQTQIQNNLQVQNSQTGILTVNVQGVSALVSINSGAQFVYVSPIVLKNGDTYSVTAQNSTSTSKCNGKASSGGSYVCNITIK